jgi:hypothetical protein
MDSLPNALRLKSWKNQRLADNENSGLIELQLGKCLDWALSGKFYSIDHAEHISLDMHSRIY